MDEHVQDSELVKNHGKTCQQHKRVEKDRAGQIPCDVVRGEPGKGNPEPDRHRRL